MVNDDKNKDQNTDDIKIVPYLRKKRNDTTKKTTNGITLTTRRKSSNANLVKGNNQNLNDKNNSESSSLPPSEKSSEINNNNYETLPSSRQRTTIISRDSNTSYLSDLIELDPAILNSGNQDLLTPILDELNIKIDNEDDDKNIKKNDKISNNKSENNKSENDNKTKSGKGKNSRYTTIRNGPKTGADINKNDKKHDSYAEQYYQQNSYLSTWRDKFREHLSELDPKFAHVNSPIEGYAKSTARAKFRRRNYEDMHFFNPITEALIRPYYGNLPIDHSNDFYTHNKLLEKWKEEKKEFVKQQKEPSIHEMLYALREKPDKTYLDKLAEDKLRTIKGNAIPGRYSLEDYRKLKNNYGFGNTFGKIKHYDPETKEEKLEKVHKRNEVGNKFMKDYIKSRANSEERDGSKTPTQNSQSPVHLNLPIIPNNDKSSYYNSLIKQLNDKNNIKMHHPVLKKHNNIYDSSKIHKKNKNNKKLPSLKDKQKNESQETSHNDSINLPDFLSPTQNNNDDFQNEDFFKNVERNDNASLLKIQYFDRLPLTSQRGSRLTRNNYTSQSSKNIDNNNNNDNNIDNNRIFNETSLVINENDQDYYDKKKLTSKSLHALDYKKTKEEDGKLTTKSSPDPWEARASTEMSEGNKEIMTILNKNDNLNQIKQTKN